MSIAHGILDWGCLDLQFLENKIDEFRLDIEDIKKYLENIGFDETNQLDVNCWIYATFDLAFTIFIENLTLYLENNEIDFDVNKIEPNIYTNCMDSGFDSVLCNYSITDFRDKNFENILKEYENN